MEHSEADLQEGTLLASAGSAGVRLAKPSKWNYDWSGSIDAPEFEAEALQTATETLFDYLCCNALTDHGEIRRAFQDGAYRAFRQRRYRTGVVEE